MSSGGIKETQNTTYRDMNKTKTTDSELGYDISILLKLINILNDKES